MIIYWRVEVWDEGEGWAELDGALTQDDNYAPGLEGLAPEERARALDQEHRGRLDGLDPASMTRALDHIARRVLATEATTGTERPGIHRVRVLIWPGRTSIHGRRLDNLMHARFAVGTFHKIKWNNGHGYQFSPTED